MPKGISISERDPITFPYKKPRKSVRTSGTIQSEKKTFLNKIQRQAKSDPAGNKSWKPPSSNHQTTPRIEPTMNKSYGDYFFTKPKGNNKPQSVHPDQMLRNVIRGDKYFR